MDPNLIFPKILTELSQLDFDYLDGDGIDFEPYASFMPEDEVESWFTAWTGNQQADGSRFLIFGQDGAGGLAAFYSADRNRSLLAQPIVFVGSEGQHGVVAKDFDNFLWLLAGGHGPAEAIENINDKKPASPTFTAFAIEHSNSACRRPSALVAEAAASCPDFDDWLQAQFR